MRIALCVLFIILGLVAVVYAYVAQASPIIFVAGLVAVIGATIAVVVELAVETGDAAIKAGIEAFTEGSRRRR